MNYYYRRVVSNLRKDMKMEPTIRKWIAQSMELK